jgi:hypothetical protein
VAQATGGAPVPVAVQFEFRSRENAVEQFDMVSGKNMVGRLRIFLDVFLNGASSSFAPANACAFSLRKAGQRAGE